jgi:hypothetical protein
MKLNSIYKYVFGYRPFCTGSFCERMPWRSLVECFGNSHKRSIYQKEQWWGYNVASYIQS